MRRISRKSKVKVLKPNHDDTFQMEQLLADETSMDYPSFNNAYDREVLKKMYDDNQMSVKDYIDITEIEATLDQFPNRDVSMYPKNKTLQIYAKWVKMYG